jgi:protein FAM50
MDDDDNDDDDDDDDDDDEDEDEDESKMCNIVDSNAEKYGPPAKKKIRKNPDVDTSFLPDREREDEENRLREEYRQVCTIFMAGCTRLFRVIGRIIDYELEKF